MSKLSAGFARVNITPMMGIGLVGYFVPRYADGVLDDLYINALALRSGDTTALLLTVDHCGIERGTVADFAAHITEATGVSRENILIHATHSHTAPAIIDPSKPPTMAQEFTSVKPDI